MNNYVLHMYVPVALPVPAVNLHGQSDHTEVNDLRERMAEIVDASWLAPSREATTSCLRMNWRRTRAWTVKEDKLLIESRRLFGNNWNAIVENMKSTGKNRDQCQNRIKYINKQKRQRTEEPTEAFMENSRQQKKAKIKVSEEAFARYRMLSEMLASKNTSTT